MLERGSTKAASRREFQSLGVRIEEKNVGRINAELSDDLIEEDVESDAQVETAADRIVDLVQ